MLLLSCSSPKHGLCLHHEPTWLLQLQPSIPQRAGKRKSFQGTFLVAALTSYTYIPLARTSHSPYLAARESVNLFSIKNRRRKGCLTQQALQVICYQFCLPVSMALLCCSSVSLPQLPLGSVVYERSYLLLLWEEKTHCDFARAENGPLGKSSDTRICPMNH